MAKVLNRLTAASLLISLLLFQTGCAVRSETYHLSPPLSEIERARLGTIGIVSADFAPETKLFAHSGGRVSGAGKGMAFERGTSFAFIPSPGGTPSNGSYMGNGGGPAVILLGLLAAGLVIGGIYRVATWIPAGEVKDIESNLKNALIDLKMQESLKDRFFKTARNQAPYNFVLIGERGPKTADEMFHYGSLNGKGVDTVIELTVLSIGFEGKGGKDPLLSLLLDTRTRVLSVSGGAVLYENKLEYRSAKRKFTEWISGKGKLFSEELDKGYGELSEKIVEELFLRYELTPGKPSGKTAGQQTLEVPKA
jgi:hypothetical protein